MESEEREAGFALDDGFCPECGAPRNAAGVVSNTWSTDEGRIHDGGGTPYTPLRPMRLLNSIDAHLARREDGTGHAVIESDSGAVLGWGATPDQAAADARNTATRLGRRRLRAAIDAGVPVAAPREDGVEMSVADRPADLSGGSAGAAAGGGSDTSGRPLDASRPEALPREWDDWNARARQTYADMIAGSRSPEYAADAAWSMQTFGSLDAVRPIDPPADLRDDYQFLREQKGWTPLQADAALQPYDEAAADMSPRVIGLGGDAVHDYLYLRHEKGWSDADATRAVGADRTPVAPFHPRNVERFKKDFVDSIYPAALASQERTGIPAAITVAQAIQESTFGARIPKDISDHRVSHNLFGIKAGKGDDYVTDWTHENIGGKKVRVLGDFAAFDSPAASIDAHAAFLQNNPRYARLFDSTDPVVWAKGLQASRYATDPGYADALIALMRDWNLIAPE